ncbi:MAG: alpha-D-ribose 1-methylphosphonate 5-triphosphate diphosphatase, partial [Pseudomonadota bacterium]
PRPGVFFDLETALIETDRQLLANGITLAYLALTISWEPGLRSLDSARKVISALLHLRPRLLCDIRIQLRWEVFALDAVDQVEAWLELDPKPTLAFNDHFTGLANGDRIRHKIPDYAARSGLTIDRYQKLLDDTKARAPDVEAAKKRLIATAEQTGVVCFAHDEVSAETRRENRALGITVSEFPLSESAAQEARSNGEETVLGAPNVLRGGSHIGALDAEPAIREGLCTVLASDYYYPSLLRAAYRLADGLPERLPSVWPTLASNAARAVGQRNRGAIEFGQRGDLVALRDGPDPCIVAVFRNGEPVYLTDAARLG